MNEPKKRRTLRSACSIIFLVAFIVVVGLAYLSNQRVESMKRAVVAAGGSAESEKRVPAWLRFILNEDSHTFLDETVLTEVTLDGPDVTDDDLKAIGEIKSLRSLDIKLSKVTSEGLKHLSGLTNLKALNLGYTQVDDLTPIEPLTQLEDLGVISTKVRDANLKSLEKFPNLQILHAGYNELTDVGISHVCRCSGLTLLGLKGTNLSEQGFRNINQLSSLEWLILLESNFRAEDFSVFQQAHPRCIIVQNEFPNIILSSE